MPFKVMLTVIKDIKMNRFVNCDNNLMSQWLCFVIEDYDYFQILIYNVWKLNAYYIGHVYIPCGTYCF